MPVWFFLRTSCFAFTVSYTMDLFHDIDFASQSMIRMICLHLSDHGIIREMQRLSSDVQDDHDICQVPH